MKKVIVLFFVLLVAMPAFSQFQRQQRRGGDPLRSRIPQTAPTETQKENRLKDIENQKQEYIANFIGTLEADDFQKQIIKQSINDYFEEKLAVLKFPFSNVQQREEAIRTLNTDHFIELKSLISEGDMSKINDMIEGKYKIEDDKKKKKKKKKRRRNKDKEN